MDCNTSNGHLIPSNLSLIGAVRTNAECIIGTYANAPKCPGLTSTSPVVEKETVFHKLAADRIWEHLPCIIVTGKGAVARGTLKAAIGSQACQEFLAKQPVAWCTCFKRDCCFLPTVSSTTIRVVRAAAISRFVV